MLNPFVKGDFKVKVVKPSQKVDYYIDREIVLKTVITGYEDKECTKPIGSMVPVVVENKKDIKILVNSHADEVGVVNILNRIIKTGDMSLLQAREAQYIDTTQLPQSLGEVQAKAIALESIYANIPEDLKKDMSLDQFVKTMTDERVKAYYDGLKNVEEKKEGQE